MVYDTIKLLRERADMSQAELARGLDISRSSVNAWEMGISVPSTQYVVELAQIFNVPTDTILGVSSSDLLDISDLTQEQQKIVSLLVRHFQSENGKK